MSTFSCIIHELKSTNCNGNISNQVTSFTAPLFTEREILSTVSKRGIRIYSNTYRIFDRRYMYNWGSTWRIAETYCLCSFAIAIVILRKIRCRRSRLTNSSGHVDRVVTIVADLIIMNVRRNAGCE
jgi:membrane-associated HD superfamily phosphohydrolase